MFVSCNPYRAIPPARIDAASTRVRPTLGQVCFSSTLASIYRRTSARAAAASGVRAYRTYDEFAADAAESPKLAKKAASASACNVNNALFWQSCEMTRFFVTLLPEPTHFFTYRRARLGSGPALLDTDPSVGFFPSRFAKLLWNRKFCLYGEEYRKWPAWIVRPRILITLAA